MYIIVMLLVILFVAITCKKNDNPPPLPTTPETNFSEGILLINEIVYKGSVNANEFGETEDWFEIFNPQDSSISMEAGKWFVTDASGFNNRKFALPELNIPAGGYVIVWCDDGGMPGGNDIHATFKLSSDGEDLGLYYDDNGVDLAIDTKTFPTYPGTISEGQSLCRLPDGSDTWDFSPTPTPGSSNN